jgi:hypothetical protein
MKTLNLKFMSFSMLAFLWLTSFNSNAQSTSYVGNWQSTAPVASMNNSIMRIKILSTSDPNVFIIINADNPKKKIIAKYKPADGKIYATVKNTPIYLVYIASSDSIQCYKQSNNALMSDLTRY